MTKLQSEFGSKKAWLVCLTGSLFFFYSFIQMGIFNSLGEPMMSELGFQATGMSYISSAYFWANILFLFPAGMMLDRFSTRKIILCSIAVMLVCTLAMAMITALWHAVMARFVFGVAGSFCLLANVRLATRWFPPQKLALVIGVVIMVSMTGLLVSQTPFALLADHVGWRATLLVDAAIGACIAVALYAFIKDQPDGVKESNSHSASLSFSRVLRNSQNWMAGIYGLLVNTPIMIFIVFGTLFFEQAEGMSRVQGTLLATVLLVGAILGSAAFGWISDRMGSRRVPMILAALISAVIAWVFMLVNLPMFYWLIVVFLLGFLSSSQVLCFALVAEHNPPELTGTAEGMASVILMSSGLVPLFFAYLLSWHWVPKMAHHIPQYGLINYHHAMLIVPAVLAICVVVSFFLKDAVSHKHEKTGS